MVFSFGFPAIELAEKIKKSQFKTGKLATRSATEWEFSPATGVGVPVSAVAQIDVQSNLRSANAFRVHAAGNESRANMREAFELLFDLLRRIDFGDEIVFFADEGGSWAIDVNWHIALPAYFRCLAETASAEDYAREVDRAIKDFSEYHRPRHLAAARRTADAAQKAALRAVRPAQTRPLSGHR